MLIEPRRVDAAVVDHLAAVPAEQRQLEDAIGARRVLPTTLAEIELVESLARHARDGARPALIALLAQFHQFAGWMCEDARAVGLAQAGQSDPDGISAGVLALIAQQEARGHGRRRNRVRGAGLRSAR